MEGAHSPGSIRLAQLMAALSLATDLREDRPSSGVPLRRRCRAGARLGPRKPSGKPRRLELRFLRSPVEILGGAQGRVRAVRIVHNRLEHGRAVPTGDEEVLECGLVLRAVGCRGEPVAGLAFDPTTGRIPNDAGRVLGEDGRPLSGEYAVGWIKRGPSGVIGTNKKCAT